MAATETQPWDVYREIHKAMRLALFGVTTLAGSTRPDDEAAIARLAAEWADVRLVLDGHHGHEDEFCDPLIALHTSHLRDELEAAHRRTDADLARLSASVDAAVAAPASQRTPLLQSLHLDLADATAAYLAHLRFEEDHVMPALNAALDDDTLAGVTDRIRGSVPPDEMCIFIRYMVPSMHFAERLDMLGGMYAGAPPEIFEMFRGAAEACLPADEYRAVAIAGGFA